MADKKHVENADSGEEIIAKAKDFWERYNKPVTIIATVIILLVGGFYIYKNFFKNPKEAKASDAIFMAEQYYRLDSVNLALNGDGQNYGFLRVIDKFGGTDAGNLANYYAGNCYIKLGENEKAIRYLKKFSTSAKQVQARAYKLLADAYADMGKNADALDYYKKAAHHFEKDEANSAEYLFMAAYLADRIMKNSKEAIELYKELKKKYPKTQQGSQVDNYLAQLGVYNTEE
jgi:tetratricopeptide (TPR) repeat protein